MTRLWSARRATAGLIALVMLSISLFALIEIARGQAFDRRPLLATWYSRAEEWLATHQWDQRVPLVGAALIALLGLVLIFVALTPGNRGLLAVRPTVDAVGNPVSDESQGAEGLRCYVLRRGLARRIAAEVGQLEEITDAQARVTRRRVRVSVRHPLESNLEEVQQRVKAVASEAIRVWGLKHSTRVVTRPDRRPA